MHSSSLIKNVILSASLMLFPNLASAQEAAESGEAVTREALAAAFQASEWTKSIDMSRALLKTEPENTDYMNILSVSLGQVGQYEEAESLMLRIKKLRPEDNQIDTNLCFVQSELKRDGALETCLEALKRNPNKALLESLTARLLEERSRLDEAREHYVRAFELDSTDMMSLTAATSIDFRHGANEKALELTQRAIAANPDKAILYLNASVAAYRAGLYEKGIEIADGGYEKFKDNALLVTKSECLYSLGRFEEAEKLLRELVEVVDEGNLQRYRVEFALGRVLVANSCSKEESKSCATETPSVCCSKEREALLQLQSARERPLLKKETGVDVYVGLAQVLNNQLEEAEATLTAAVSDSSIKDKGNALAALAAALYQYSDKKDREAALGYYVQAKGVSEDFSDSSVVRSKYGWAPRLVETLEQIKAEDAAKNAPKAKSGCGCDVMGVEQKQPILAMILSLLLVGLCVVTMRRKSA